MPRHLYPESMNKERLDWHKLGDDVEAEIQLEGGNHVTAGVSCYVKWDTFPESRQERWKLFTSYEVQGIYKEECSRGWKVYFPALGKTYTLGKTWIATYGSKTTPGRQQITGEIYKQVTGQAHCNKTKRNTAAGQPEIGSNIYCCADTFMDLKDKVTNATEVYVLGVIKSSNKTGWRVYFPVLGRGHQLTRLWFEAYAKQQIPMGGRILSKEEVRTRTANESHPTSSTEVPSDEMSRSDELDIGTDKVYLAADVVTPANYEPNALGISHLNAARFDETTMLHAHWLRTQGCGIFSFVDTQHLDGDLKHYRRIWKQQVGMEAKICATMSVGTTRYVGGQMVCIDPYWGRRLRGNWCDPSMLGIVHEVTFNITNGIVRVISVYWPSATFHPESESLGARLQRWLQTQPHWKTTTCDEYIREQIHRRMKKQAKLTVLLGDFNRTEESIRQTLSISNLENAHYNQRPVTYWSGARPVSTIDYMFHNGCTRQASHTSGEKWSYVSDHRTIWAIFDLPMPVSSIHKVIKRKRYLNLQCEKDKDTYVARLTDVTRRIGRGGEVENSVESICKQMVNAARSKSKPNHMAWWTPLVKLIVLRLKIIKLMTNVIDHRTQRPTYQLAELLEMLYSAPAVQNHIDQWNELHECKHITDLREIIASPQVRRRLHEEKIQTWKLLQGRRRKQRAEKYYEYIAKLKKEPYKFYKSFRDQGHHIDLTHLRTSTSTLRDPKEIDSVIVDYFQKEFAAIPIGLDMTWDDTTDFEIFRTKVAAEIPERELRSFWVALRNVPPQRQAQVAQKLTFENCTPTFAEFLCVLHTLNRDSAPGPSGVTYRMIFYAPQEIQRQLFDALTLHWNHRTTPRFWKSKLMFPLAKKENNFLLKNIRPIILLEVTRKLWFKIIAGKIRTALESTGILQQNQYGFRPHRSCADNLVQLINAIEANAELYGSSLDIVGAFNAPPRPWLQLGLERLGVPLWLAEILVKLDQDDSTTILTPYHCATQRGATFKTERGCGQGDVISPLLWTCFFDIIMTSLNEIDSELSFIDSMDQIHSVQDTAFADDLLALAKTPQILQSKATAVSIASNVMGFQLAKDKFRTFTTAPAEAEVTIYEWGWKPFKFQCQQDGLIKYLGSNQEIRSSNTEFAVMQNTVLRSLQRMQHKIHKPEHALLNINNAVIPKLLYPAQFGKLLSRQVRKLDIQLARLYKQQSHLTASFPTPILNATKTVGGMGYRSLADAIPSTKWSLLQRITTSPSKKSRAAADSLLARNSHLFTKSKHHLKVCSDGWMADVCAYLADHAITAEFHHSFMYNDLDQLLPEHQQLPVYRIFRIGDVVQLQNDRLISYNPDRLTMLTHQWPTLQLPPFQVYIRPGHLWANPSAEGEIESVYEILGWQHGVLVANCWQLTPPWKFKRTKYVLRNAPVRLKVDPNFNLKCVALHTTTQPQLILAVPIRSKVRKDNPAPISTNYCEEIVASDGSFTPGLFGEIDAKTTGSYVRIQNSAPYTTHRQIHCLLPTTAKRSFLAETVAALLACHENNRSVHTDCKSLVTTGIPGESDIEKLLQRKRHQLRWVASHPERRLALKNWTPLDHAIFWADKIATKPEKETITVTYTQICDTICHRSNVWLLRTTEGLLTSSLMATATKSKLDEYLRQRVKDGHAQWSYATYKYLLDCHSSSSILQRGAIIKLYLGRFEVDRMVMEHQQPSCMCGCRNSLEDWSTVCTRVEVVNSRRAFQAALTKLLMPERLKYCLRQLLSSKLGQFLIRGNWVPSLRKQIFMVAPHQPERKMQWAKGLKVFTKLITAHALELYQICNPRINSSSKRTRWHDPQQTLDRFLVSTAPDRIVRTSTFTNGVPDEETRNGKRLKQTTLTQWRSYTSAENQHLTIEKPEMVEDESPKRLSQEVITKWLHFSGD